MTATITPELTFPVHCDAQQKLALTELHYHLKPGDTVWSVWRGTSSSGMTRWFDFYVIRDNEPLRLTYLMCVAMGYRYDTKREALKTQGCGMDMAFDAVYTLGSSMWPLGTPTPHSTRNGEPDSHGGYALTHRSLG